MIHSICRHTRLLHLCIAHFCGRVRNSSSSTAKPPISQKVKFVDQLRVVAKGGSGGGGTSALFGRTGHHPRAAGGHGASGGAVILRASKQLTGLGSIALHIEAARGGNGGTQWRDGKRGADKIVDVPLGTLVYQLLQLKGSTGDPDGVTAVQPSVRAAISSSGCASSDASGSSNASNSASSNASRRKLFPHISQPQSAASKPGSSSISSSGSDSSSSIQCSQTEGAFHTQSESGSPLPTGAAEGSLIETEASETEVLFEQLVSCQRLLTNAEKLCLLTHGRLPRPPWGNAGTYQPGGGETAAAGMSGAEDEYDNSENDPDMFSDSGDEQTASSDEDNDDWIVLPPAEGGETAAAGGGCSYETQLERQYTKKQVWSVLESQAVFLGELTQEGQTLTVAAGGKGGRGNAGSASKPHGPASRARGDGAPGQEVMLLLKLKLLADVVLVGLPNVGKSSLIARLTHARAQVGSYAFTTLRPQLGIVVTDVHSNDSLSDQPPATAPAAGQGNTLGSAEAAAAAAAAIGPAGTSISDYDSSTESGSSPLVLADLPGLVPGAHAGKGRGVAFLAHLQRARCLALVVDMTGGAEGQQQQLPAGGDRVCGDDPVSVTAGGWEALVPYAPTEQLAILQDELQQFDTTVLQLPMLVVANKLDMMSPTAAAAALQSLKAATTLPIMPVSAKQGLGLQRLKSALRLLVGASSRHSSM